MTAECKGSLNAARRSAELDLLTSDNEVDVLVVGAGVTGVGVALDAASRGLNTLLVDKHDLAFGTSRFSSKLVHGGLRYLAHGQVGIAHESSVERDILLRRTAPHLVRALPMVLPLLPQVGVKQAALARAGFLAGDLLRAAARTPSSVLPRSRRIAAAEVLHSAPGVRRSGLRGGLLSWDGQLEDDARLVVALARTAAANGARIITRCAAEELDGTGAVLRDQLTGNPVSVRARAVVNATGVWASELVDEVKVRPSRGSHLVLAPGTLGDLRCAITVAVPGELNRFVFALPQPGGRVYAGLTDVPAEHPIPDVPESTPDEIDFLLGTLNSVLRTPVRRDQVIGSYAGLRPLLDAGGQRTADLSRKHEVHVSRTGVVTVVGGKLTTYRAMAEDAVDKAVERGTLWAGPCRTRRLPAVGAGPAVKLAAIDAPARLIARYGTEAPTVVAEAGGDPELLEPVAEGVEVTGAELLFALRHEGALDAGDLLDRRTRIGLVPADRERAAGAVRQALDRVR